MGFSVGSGARWYQLAHQQKKPGPEWSHGPRTGACGALAPASGARAGHEVSEEKPAAPKEKVRTRNIGKTKISHSEAIALRAKTNTNWPAGKRSKKHRTFTASHILVWMNTGCRMSEGLAYIKDKMLPGLGAPPQGHWQQIQRRNYVTPHE